MSFPALLRFAIVLAAAFLLSPASTFAAEPTLEERVALLFRPPLADQIALAPDGRHVAYTQYADGDLIVRIVDVDSGATTARIAVGSGRDVPFSKEKDPARLRMLRWATPHRLVFAPTIVTLPGPPRMAIGGVSTLGLSKYIAPLLAIDADGKNARELVDARDFEQLIQRPQPAVDEGGPPPPPLEALSRPPFLIGFPDGDRTRFLVETPGGTFTFAALNQVIPTDLVRVDLATGKTDILSSDQPGRRYVYDRQGNRRIARHRAANATDDVIDYQAADGKGGWRPLAARVKTWSDAAWRTSAGNFYGERAIPLDFDYDPDVLYVASNVGRDAYAIHALDLNTGEARPLELDSPRVDFGELNPGRNSDVLVFDEYRRQLVGVRALNARRTTLWRDEELGALQRAMDDAFPRSSVQIINWSTDRTRYLLRVTSGKDPGRCFVYLRNEQRLREITRRAPWLEDAALHDTAPFAFFTPAGVRLTGYVTAPRRPRLAMPPVIVCFAPDFPAHAHEEFDPEAHVLADMGFVVVRLNQRGTLGFGRAHLDATAGGLDRAPVEDARAVIEWLATHTKIDRKRIATFGRGFAGYLAVRAVQREPDFFRCAIAIDAPLDPNNWLAPEATRDLVRDARRALLERGAPDPVAISAVRQADKLTRPVLLVTQPGQNSAVDESTAQFRSRSALAETFDVATDFSLNLPFARARAYRRMLEFFNVNLYDFDVKIGEAKEVK